MRLFISIALAAAVTTACGGQAKADVLVASIYAQGQAGTLGEPSVDITPSQFNAALGTLTGVTLSYRVFLQSGLNVDGMPANPGFYSVQNTLNIYTDYVTGGNAGQAFSEGSVPVPDSTVYIPSSPSGVLFATSYVESDVTFSVSALYLDSFTTNYDDFKPYVGFYPNSQLYPNADDLAADDDLDNLEILGSETFTYTPIPEPASLALLPSGLLTIVTAARYRRKSSLT